jgi:TatA/E family protein of Tat protein translocase
VFGNLGAGEIVILLVIALLVFGAHKLPEAGRAVGKGIREFQRALRDTKDEIERADEPRPPRSPAPPGDAGPKRLSE